MCSYDVVEFYCLYCRMYVGYNESGFIELFFWFWCVKSMLKLGV